MPRPVKNISGETFGDWTVLHRAPNIGMASAYMCVCRCGERRAIRTTQLTGGHSTGCGCARDKRLGDRARKHGAHRHPLYGTWRSMRERCRSPAHAAYASYGGRGIKVCKRWDDFSTFLQDVEHQWRPGLTLDRIDNDGDYEPGNIRWASRKAQTRNRRNNRRLEFQGQTLTLSAWAERIGISPVGLAGRLKRGLTVEEAFTLPLGYSARSRKKKQPD